MEFKVVLQLFFVITHSHSLFNEHIKFAVAPQQQEEEKQQTMTTFTTSSSSTTTTPKSSSIMIVADETATELRQHAAPLDSSTTKEHPHEYHLWVIFLLLIVCVSLLSCALFEDHPLLLATRVLRGEFPDNDAFVAFLEFYHT